MKIFQHKNLSYESFQIYGMSLIFYDIVLLLGWYKWSDIFPAALHSPCSIFIPI